MAFVKGQLITADELNNVGKNTVLKDYEEHNNNNNNYWSTFKTHHLYIRQASGKMVYVRTKDYGYWTGGRTEMKLTKYVNGVFEKGSWRYGTWKDIASIKPSFNKEAKTTWNSQGSGLYAVRIKGRGNFRAEWHWGVRDAKKHHYLRYYSGLPWNPSYTKGTPLTAGVLNSGKVGTSPNI